MGATHGFDANSVFRPTDAQTYVNLYMFCAYVISTLYWSLEESQM
jgi:hypothetical protein